MKIVREDEKLAMFGDVPIGGVFIIPGGDDVYMKISKVYEIETNGTGRESRWSYNAVCLSEGELYLFNDSDMVRISRDAYLTVK